MNKCIYTLKTDGEATFDSGEHIFPKGIGGTVKLDKGWVSKEFNNKISSAEREFLRKYPLVVLPRIFEGSSGRKEHKGKLGVSFVKELDTNELKLGYIERNIPIIIPQIIFKYNEKPSYSKIKMIAKSLEELYIFIDKLKTHEENFEIIHTPNDSFKDYMSFGITNKQAYVGTHNSLNDDLIKIHVEKFLKFCREVHLDKFKSNNNKKIEKHFIEQNIEFGFNIFEVYRVYAKIVFNCLAKLKGQEFVLQNKFDNIRNSIVTGKNIDKFVSLPNLNDKDLSKILQLGKAHIVTFSQVNDKLLGKISLFGGEAASFGILLSEFMNSEDNFGTDGYICDWENKKEFTLMEHILSLNNIKI